MNRFRELLREPALLIDLVETLIVLLVAFGVTLSGDQQTYIVAAVVALLGLAKGLLTRPFAVTLLTDAARAVLVLAASFGVGLTSDQIALIATGLGTIVTLIARGQITPAKDPRPLPEWDEMDGRLYGIESALVELPEQMSAAVSGAAVVGQHRRGSGNH